jgi:starch phosphorylase
MHVSGVLILAVKLYLMDTDVPENNQYDRALTERLYGGDRETRIQQEILLGIGGIRTLDALGIKGTVYHMNEGHSAFMALELARKLVMEKNMPLGRQEKLFILHRYLPPILLYRQEMIYSR